ncbi:MAG: cysteine hydrolase [Zoogloeaceae bacterium]|jgi:nicotinamidase-related amidase|nr:cysteine hydrolase [Zoogloeaceae bacterium]
MKTCLLLVDIQNGFISDNTSHILPEVEKLISQKKYDFMVATQFINLEKSPFQCFMHWYRLMASPEIDLYSAVAANADLIIKKNVYTAVNDELLGFIRKNGIEEVYVAGIDTDCCVLTTAVGLFEHGIRPYVLAHYSASNGGQQSHDAGILALCRMIGSDSIIQGEIK